MAPDIRTLFQVFGRIGVLSFGGPAAQIALMHKELVEDRDWLKEEQFLRALSFCMLLPGPEAMQLATYAGWRQRGIVGGLLAGGLFVIPGAIVIMALALAYGVYGDLAWMQALFLGVQAAVVVIVIGALRKVMAKALHGRKAIGIALAAFVALCAFQIPFPVVILVAALIGAMTRAPKDAETSPPLDMKNSLYVIVIGAVIWSVPIGIAWLMGSTFLVEIGLFFSKLAVVTFGGAYSVLAYMTQTVVADHGWISTAQMMDALGLAETFYRYIPTNQVQQLLTGGGLVGTGETTLATDLGYYDATSTSYNGCLMEITTSDGTFDEMARNGIAADERAADMVGARACCRPNVPASSRGWPGNNVARFKNEGGFLNMQLGNSGALSTFNDRIQGARSIGGSC